MVVPSRNPLDRRVLTILRESGPGTAAQIAKRLDAEASVVASALGRLRRKGLLRRATRPGDSRSRPRRGIDYAWEAVPTGPTSSVPSRDRPPDRRSTSSRI